MTYVYIIASLFIGAIVLVLAGGIIGWWLFRKEIRKGADDDLIQALTDEIKAEYPEGWRSVTVTQPELRCSFCGSKEHTPICDSPGSIVTGTTGCPNIDKFRGVTQPERKA